MTKRPPLLPNPFMEMGDDDAFLLVRSPLGQYIHDIGFSKLSDRYLARKHGKPLAEIRKARADFKRGFRQGQREAAAKSRGSVPNPRGTKGSRRS